MSTIKVKSRRELVIVPEEKAQSLKRKWLDESVPRDTKVDLGNWAGELGEIKQIDTDKELKYDTPDTSMYYMGYDEFEKYTMERKVIYGIEWFKFILWGRTINEHEKRNLTEEQKTETKNILVKFYSENPRDPLPPPDLFGELLPPRKINKRGGGWKTLANAITSN